MQAFPVDDLTLELLAASCRINPDSGHTELLTFLDFGSVEKKRTLLEDGPTPVYEVEFEDGHEPWSPQGVIESLVAEIQRLRGRLRELGEAG